MNRNHSLEFFLEGEAEREKNELLINSRYVYIATSCFK